MKKSIVTLVTVAIAASVIFSGVVSTGCAGTGDQQIQELEASSPGAVGCPGNSRSKG